MCPTILALLSMQKDEIVKENLPQLFDVVLRYHLADRIFICSPLSKFFKKVNLSSTVYVDMQFIINGMSDHFRIIPEELVVVLCICICFYT